MNWTMAWNDPNYRQTALTVLSIIFVSGAIVYFLRKSGGYFVAAWASIKSWLVAAPLMFLIFAFPYPIPLIALVLIALAGAKIYFQILGMYHRSYFVLIAYAGIIGLGYACYLDNLYVFNNMPMIVLGAACLVPLVRNSYSKMIQYICLTLLGFIFLGWSFLHLGLVMNLPNGLYQILYLVVLTEFCDNTNLAVHRYFRWGKMFSNIDPKRTVGSTIVSVVLTLFLAATMRWLLPDQSEKYWLAAGLVASLVGMVGDLVMDVVRRDAGVKVVGPFILGRGDFLHRMDRLIFVAPIYYYVMLAVSQIVH